MEFRYRYEKEFCAITAVELQGNTGVTAFKPEMLNCTVNCEHTVVVESRFGTFRYTVPANTIIDYQNSEAVFPIQYKIPLADFIPTEEELEIDLFNAIDITN